MPSVWADDLTARQSAALVGLAASQMTATRATRGTTCFRISSCFVLTSGVIWLQPVTLPPGRARLATSPLPTGSPCTMKMMGMVFVACPTQIAQPLLEGLGLRRRGRACPEHAQPRGSFLLRLGDERRGEKHRTSASKERASVQSHSSK